MREILESAYERVVRACVRWLRAEQFADEVRDAFHEVAVRMLAREKSWPVQWNHVRSWPAYLTQSTLNAYRRAKRGERRFAPESVLWKSEEEGMIDWVPSRDPVPPWMKVAEAEMGGRIREWVERLPQQQRRVFRLFLGGCSHGEIARILGISPGNARFHKHAALQSILSYFEVAS